MKRRKKPRASAPRERDPAEDSGIYPYLANFLAWCASRNYAEQTTLLRDTAIRRFIRWCKERSIDRPQDVTRPILERYRRHLYHYRKENGEPLSFGLSSNDCCRCARSSSGCRRKITSSGIRPRSWSCRESDDDCRRMS